MRDTLIDLRHTLHKYPDLSGQEKRTAELIKEFLQSNSTAELIDHIGGFGLAAIYDYGTSGPTIMIRCELDALPINEGNDFPYKSLVRGVAHKCGHDGHMVMVAGLVHSLNEMQYAGGRVVLLFQPSEENGRGAQKVIQDDKFKLIQPDYVFALHNIPGQEMHTIIHVPKAFSPTVQSVVIYLEGKECHAAQPDQGINPSAGISEILASLAMINNHDPLDDLFAILTPVHVTMGQVAYGLSPGKAELHYTLRSWTPEVMSGIKAHLEEVVARVCDVQGLSFSLDWLEYFPSTVNNNDCNEMIKKVAEQKGLSLYEKEYPFRFGEDFGWYSSQYKSAMFGLGAGLNTPALHHDDYDFPDQLISTGIEMFLGIIEDLLG